jgi:riboflavin biosynthesis pyrimidine reductase
VPLAHRIFTTPGISPLVVTTPGGAVELEHQARPASPPPLLVDDLLTPEGLRRAHQRLFAEHGVRYLDCEGGQTILASLHSAGLLDEVFLTITPFVIDESAHAAITKTFDFEAEGASLIAEGRAPADEAWLFRRWRFNQR